MHAVRSIVATILFVVFSGQAVADPPSPQVSCLSGALDALLPSSLLDELDSITPTLQIAQDAPASRDARRTLVEFALQLRDIRYRRGGRMPATGFDCSGFVHYVFANVLGLDLPADSASQYSSGERVARAEMQAGDLVFFHMHGKRVSHVGIYLGDGQFIHAPTTGQSVKVNNLAQTYWARRFAGARRPQTTA